MFLGSVERKVADIEGSGILELVFDLGGLLARGIIVGSTLVSTALLLFCQWEVKKSLAG